VQPGPRAAIAGRHCKRGRAIASSDDEDADVQPHIQHPAQRRSTAAAADEPVDGARPMVVAAPTAQAVAPSAAMLQQSLAHQADGQQQLQQSSRSVSDQPNHISQRPHVPLHPCAPRQRSSAVDTAAPDTLAEQQPPPQQQQQQQQQQHRQSDAASAGIACATATGLPQAAGGRSQPVEVLNLASSDEDTQPLPDAVPPPQPEQHRQAARPGDGSATAACAGNASHGAATSGLPPSVGWLAAAPGSSPAAAATQQQAEQPGPRQTQQQQQRRREASYLCTLLAAAAAPGARFPLRLCVNGSVKTLAGRLQFRDPATGAPLPEYSIMLEVEDGSLAVHAALDHAVIQRWIGAYFECHQHMLAHTCSKNMWLTGLQSLLPVCVCLPCP
jgi:hypothetical protein